MSFVRSLAAAVAAANVINEVGAAVLHKAPKRWRTVHEPARVMDDDVPDMPRIVLPPLPKVPQPLSLAEIKANMTVEEAHRIFHGIVHKAGLQGKQFHKAIAFVQEADMGNLRGVSKHTKTMDDSTVGSSMNLMNSLIMEKSLALEEENEKCAEKKDSLENQIMKLGSEISEAQRESSQLVGHILLGQAVSKTLGKNIEDSEAILDLKKETFKKYMIAVRKELKLVNGDLAGMNSILGSEFLNCNETVDSVQTADSIQTSLVQAGKNMKSVVECQECADGVQVGLLKGDVHRKMSGMTSKAGKEALQGLLVESGSGRLLLQLSDGLRVSKVGATGTSDDTECNESMGVDMKGQGYVGCQNKTIDGQTCTSWADSGGTDAERALSDNYCRNPEGKSTIYCMVPKSSDYPGGFQFCTPVQLSRNFDGKPRAPDCAQAAGCVLTKGSCEKLKAQFEDVHGALETRSGELQADERQTEEDWKEESGIMEHEINALTEDQETTDAKLAGDKGTLHTTQAKMTEDTMDYTQTTAEFEVRMNKCCALKTELVSEKCALMAVRAKLENETSIEVVDCEVGPWQNADSTGGCFYPHGADDQPSAHMDPTMHFCIPAHADPKASMLVRTQVREIERNVSYGTACPVLQKQELCTDMPVCDVDCAETEWSSWSDCSAECGGGTRTSTRQVKIEAQGAGMPCGAGVWTESCALDPCNKDCKLQDWEDDWGRCSRSCTLLDEESHPIGGYGHRERFRPIAEERKGTGAQCKHPREQCGQGNEGTCRMESKECNQETECQINASTSLITCGGEFDLYFLIDSSGSLGRRGFTAQQNMVVDIMKGLSDRVSTAVLDWSGPSWRYRADCRNATFEEKYPDVCGFNWVVPEPILDHTKAEGIVEDMPFHWRYTYAHTALDETSEKIRKVQASSTRKRESVVVLLIDGIPTYTGRAMQSAERLKADLGDGKLVVMALNYAARNDRVHDMVIQMASEPKKDNFVTALSWPDMVLPATMNKLLLTICPDTDGETV